MAVRGQRRYGDCPRSPFTQAPNIACTRASQSGYDILDHARTTGLTAGRRDTSDRLEQQLEVVAQARGDVDLLRFEQPLHLEPVPQADQ